VLNAQVQALATTTAALAALNATVQELAARPPGPTTEDVQLSVDAAVAGAISLLLTGDNALTSGVAGLKTRLDQIDEVLTGLPQTRKVVSELAADVAYLLLHSANVTACASTGDVHAGDGTCIDPVPQCPPPTAPKSGKVTLSADFIIPGVTAEYVCPGALAFVAGPSVRTCVEATLQFDGTAPSCQVCTVTNCERCVDDVKTCAKCAYGHDLAADSKSCPERADTIVAFENGAQSLAAKATSWSRFYPTAPIYGTNAQAALMRGTIYLVGHGGHGSTGGFYKLDKGSLSWDAFPVIKGTTQFDTAWIGRVENPAFYCTINGVGSAEDGFYIFYLLGSAVYQPAVDDTKWKALPAHGNGDGRNIRSQGATAVVGSKVYLMGGKAASAPAEGRYSVLVDVFDTTAGKFSAGVPMTAGRIGHSAASYNGKIYVFGGRSAANVVIKLVETFDPSTEKWATKTPMPEAWEKMSTGPMPVFANGVVLIPFSYNSGGVHASLEYDTKADSWENGPAPVLKGGKYAVVQGALE
jgi:hypothetical protein